MYHDKTNFFFFFDLFCFVLFFVKEEKMPFFGRNLECNVNFRIVNCTPKSLETTQISKSTRARFCNFAKNGGAKYRFSVPVECESTEC